MAGQIVECQVCKTVSKSELRGSTWISFILFWFVMIAPGIIYMIWRRGGIGVCANCKSPAVVPYVKRANTTQPTISDKTGNKLVAHDAFSHNAGRRIQADNNDVEQKNCPDCRELIRFDARKCKHCGSMVEDTP